MRNYQIASVMLWLATGLPGFVTAQDYLGASADLKGLWRVVAAAADQQPVAATNLLRLTASAAELDKLESDPEASIAAERARMMERLQAGHEAQTPAAAVAQTPFVSIVGQMILDESGEAMNE
jgi:hypothetical protein